MIDYAAGYIDPGTGSMLFTLLIGAATTGYFFARKLIIRARFAMSGGRAKALDDNRHPYVIFSDDKRYWNVFKPICDEFERRGIDVCYWTASPDDPALEEEYEHVTCEFIGEENKAFARLNMMEADIVLSTTPGLDVYQWKRSKGVSVYVHTFHTVGTALGYRMFGMDYYDAILLAGDYQIDEIRTVEQARGIPEKELVCVGSTYLDAMAERVRLETGVDVGSRGSVGDALPAGDAETEAAGEADAAGGEAAEADAAVGDTPAAEGVQAVADTPAAEGVQAVADETTASSGTPGEAVPGEEAGMALTGAKDASEGASQDATTPDAAVATADGGRPAEAAEVSAEVKGIVPDARASESIAPYAGVEPVRAGDAPVATSAAGAAGEGIDTLDGSDNRSEGGMPAGSRAEALAKAPSPIRSLSNSADGRYVVVGAPSVKSGDARGQSVTETADHATDAAGSARTTSDRDIQADSSAKAAPDRSSSLDAAVSQESGQEASQGSSQDADREHDWDDASDAGQQPSQEASQESGQETSKDDGQDASQGAGRVGQPQAQGMSSPATGASAVVAATESASKDRHVTVLLAPSWGPNAILSVYGERIIDAILDTGFELVIRPHPQSKTSDKEILDALMAKYPDGERVEWNFDVDNFDCLSRADIMVTDFSGVIFDYALVFDRPVIYTPANYDDGLYDAAWYDKPQWRFETYPSFGIPLDEADFPRMREVIEATIADESLAAGRAKARAEAWAHPGEAAVRTVDYLVARRERMLREAAEPETESTEAEAAIDATKVDLTDVVDAAEAEQTDATVAAGADQVDVVDVADADETDAAVVAGAELTDAAVVAGADLTDAVDVVDAVDADQTDAIDVADAEQADADAADAAGAMVATETGPTDAAAAAGSSDEDATVGATADADVTDADTDGAVSTSDVDLSEASQPTEADTIDAADETGIADSSDETTAEDASADADAASDDAAAAAETPEAADEAIESAALDHGDQPADAEDQSQNGEAEAQADAVKQPEDHSEGLDRGDGLESGGALDQDDDQKERQATAAPSDADAADLEMAAEAGVRGRSGAEASGLDNQLAVSMDKLIDTLERTNANAQASVMSNAAAERLADELRTLHEDMALIHEDLAVLVKLIKERRGIE